MLSVDFASLVTIGGKGTETNQHSVVDHAGDVYTVGRFVGKVDFDPSSKANSLTGQDDPGTLYLAKYSPDGTLLWAHQLGADTVIPLLTAGLAVDESDNLYIAGSFEGSVDFDASTRQTVLTSVGHHDIFVAKYDVLGELEWARCFGGTDDDVATAITVTSDNLIAIAGRYTGEVDFDPTAGVVLAPSPQVVGDGPLDSYDGFVNVLDDQGAFDSALTIGTPLIDAITSDSEGSIYLAGHFQGTNVFFDPAEGDGDQYTSSQSGTATDIFVEKLDNQFNVQWVQTLVGTATITAIGVTGTDVLVGGSASNVVTTSTPGDEGSFSVFFPAGGAGFLASSDADTGELQWVNQLGTSVNDFTIADSSVFVTGTFIGTADLDPSVAVDSFTSATSSAFVGSYSASDGSLAWARVLTGTGTTNPTSIGFHDDDIVVGGAFTGTTDFDPNKTAVTATSAGSTDTFIVRLRQVFAESTLAFNAHISAQFVDADGDLVTISMKGPGGGTVHLDTGSIDTNIVSLSLSNTTTKTTVTITNKTGTTTIGAATITGSLGNLNAPSAVLQGAATLSGTAKKFYLGGASGSLTISGDTALPKLSFGNVSGFALTTVAPIKSLNIGSWSGSGSSNKIVAPSIGKVTSNGSFTPNVTLSAIGLKAKTATLGSVAAGGLIGGTWNITGSVGNISTGGNFSASIKTDTIKAITVGGDFSGGVLSLGYETDTMTLGKLTVAGFLASSSIRTTGNLGSIIAGAFSNSIIFAGVKPIFTSLLTGQLPDDQSDFNFSRNIQSVTATGIDGVPFSFVNTDIAARSIGTINLGMIQLANSNIAFGVAAVNVGFTGSLESQGDFELRILRV